MHCSIGVMAYNEEKNIAHLLESLLNQKLEKVIIDKIFVVSSGCTDKTNDIVREYEEKDNRIILIDQKERRGKSSAINLFLKQAESEILVLESGDTIPYEDCIETLVNSFENEKVGMVGTHPIPVNKDNTLIGYSVNLLWRLHHELAMRSPKLGEMVAFRNKVDGIPEKSAVDEASLEQVIVEKGYTLMYNPAAYVMNKGPENFRDYISQRKRIYSGHIWLVENFKYKVASMDSGSVVSILLNDIRRNPKDILKTIFVVAVEVYSRILGYYDYRIKKKNPFTWEIAKSTKELIKD